MMATWQYLALVAIAVGVTLGTLALCRRGECAAFTLRPCPFCGHQPDEDNLIDSIHPATRDRSVWEAGCLASEGGCDSFVLGWSKEGAIAQWNTRKEAQ